MEKRQGRRGINGRIWRRKRSRSVRRKNQRTEIENEEKEDDIGS
jgi:hypothetical protein